MGIKDIIILLLVVAIVTVVITLIMTRKKNQSATSSQFQKSSNSPAISNQLASTTNQEGRPRVKDYSKQLSKGKELLERFNKVIAIMMGKSVYVNFDAKYALIVKAFERFNGTKKEVADSAVFAQELLNSANFSDSPSELMKIPNKIGETVINIYVEGLLNISAETGADVSRYSLNADAKAEQVRKVGVNISGYISGLFPMLKEIEHNRAMLESNLQRLQELTNSEWGAQGWGNFAKGAGLGVMAVTNPLVGIPLAIGHFLGSSEKDKNNEKFIDTYISQFDQFINKVLELWVAIEVAEECIYKYVLEKNAEINSTAKFQIINELIQSGVNFDKYFSQIKKEEKELIALENEWGISK